jgi:protein-disulfide isomerase
LGTLRGKSRNGHARFAAVERVRRRWISRGATAAVLAIVIGYLLWSQWPRAGAPPLSAARLALDPSLGPANAPVTLIEYADFGCPTCQTWYQSHTLEQVLAKYPNKIHFIWRDFPIITSDSPKAAEAGQCAFDQAKFWPFHDIVYDNAPAISTDDLKSYAASVGLDTKRFDQCLDSGQDAAKVNQSLQDANSHGFLGTPSFLLNGRPLAGPPSFAYLVSLIDPILAGK